MSRRNQSKANEKTDKPNSPQSPLLPRGHRPHRLLSRPQPPAPPPTHSREPQLRRPAPPATLGALEPPPYSPPCLRPNPSVLPHNRRSAPYRSIHGNRRSAPCAATADRGGHVYYHLNQYESLKAPLPTLVLLSPTHQLSQIR
jgi:hypothetical protein